MSGDNEAICGEVKAAISFVVGGITEEDAACGPRGEFVRGSGGGVGVTSAAENPKVLVGGCCAEKCSIRAGGADRLRGEAVQQVCGSVETFRPVAPGKGSLDQQGANNVINGANNTLSFTILRRSVRTRHPQCSALGEKEEPTRGVVKLPPIVTLDGLDRAAELSSNIGKKKLPKWERCQISP